jgi:single-stranded DNA-specific DHH superfamily exonuclease
MKLKYDCGSESDFLSFMNNIGEEDNVALISHIDLDGITSAKVINQIVSPKVVKLVHYEEFNDSLFSELKSEGVNKVVITDLGINNPEVLYKLSGFCEILIIDHHEFRRDFNSEKIIFINSRDYCASFICYSLVSKIKNVEKVDWLVALACVADCMWENNVEFMKRVYLKYGEEFNEKNPRKGRFWELIKTFSLSIIYFQKNLVEFYHKIKEDIDYVNELKDYYEIVRRDLNGNKKSFEVEREKIPGGWFFEVKSDFNIESLLATNIGLENKDKIVVLAIKKKSGLYKISARENDMRRNMALLLQKVTEGFVYENAGGHVPAAGASVAQEDYEEFKKRLRVFDLEEIAV